VIAEILGSIDGITPKGRREASISKHGLCSVFKHMNAVFNFTILGVGIRNHLLKSDATFNKVHYQGTFDKFESTISMNSFDAVTGFTFPSGCDGFEGGDSVVFPFDEGCTSYIRGVIKDCPEVSVALGSNDGKQATGIHVKEVADLSGMVPEMRIWRMGVFANQTRNTVSE
jgi:hypothetical protein